MKDRCRIQADRAGFACSPLLSLLPGMRVFWGRCLALVRCVLQAFCTENIFAVLASPAFLAKMFSLRFPALLVPGISGQAFLAGVLLLSGSRGEKGRTGLAPSQASACAC